MKVKKTEQRIYAMAFHTALIKRRAQFHVHKMEQEIRVLQQQPLICLTSKTTLENENADTQNCNKIFPDKY
jgi:hypothetical protein